MEFTREQIKRLEDKRGELLERLMIYKDAEKDADRKQRDAELIEFLRTLRTYLTVLAWELR